MNSLQVFFIVSRSFLCFFRVFGLVVVSQNYLLMHRRGFELACSAFAEHSSATGKESRTHPTFSIRFAK